MKLSERLRALPPYIGGKTTQDDQAAAGLIDEAAALLDKAERTLALVNGVQRMPFNTAIAIHDTLAELRGQA